MRSCGTPDIQSRFFHWHHCTTENGPALCNTSRLGLCSHTLFINLINCTAKCLEQNLIPCWPQLYWRKSLSERGASEWYQYDLCSHLLIPRGSSQPLSLSLSHADLPLLPKGGSDSHKAPIHFPGILHSSCNLGQVFFGRDGRIKTIIVICSHTERNKKPPHTLQTGGLHRLPHLSHCL